MARPTIHVACGTTIRRNLAAATAERLAEHAERVALFQAGKHAESTQAWEARGRKNPAGDTVPAPELNPDGWTPFDHELRGIVEGWHKYDLAMLAGTADLTASAQVVWRRKVVELETAGHVEIRGRRASHIRLTPEGTEPSGLH